MGFKTGIVGLPNVGKSTIFNALTSAKAEAANFPFCTIEPNTGVVHVPDPRLDHISEIFKPQKTIPATTTFVDIAGLVEGASKGEGLGNQFLSHIRETNSIAHVVRCFDDSGIVHVSGKVDPIGDISVIDTELALADMETVSKRFTQISKIAKTGDKKARAIWSVLEIAKAGLEEGKPVRMLGIEPHQMNLISDLHLLTTKKVMYVANISDSEIENPDSNPYLTKLKEHASKEGAPVLVICGKIESELAELELEEKKEFLKDYNMDEPGLNRVIRMGFELLNLQTYFTAGEKEVRAWTTMKGASAPEAAGVIHTDFQKGFIKAEVYHYDDLVQFKTEAAIKDAGKLRIEGKDYEVKDGDIMHFRFNV